VFGLSSTQDSKDAEEDVDQSLWGEMESEEEEEEDDDETRDHSDKPSDREADESGIATPSEGLATPSGFASISNGMETPDIIELRKRKIEAEMERSVEFISKYITTYQFNSKCFFLFFLLFDKQ
jgi:splicing factor 3B subunit 2